MQLLMRGLQHLQPTPTRNSHSQWKWKKTHSKEKIGCDSQGKRQQTLWCKNFEEALAAYDEAIALDPASMTLLSNKTAVCFAQKDWDKCIEVCDKAMEVGTEHMALFSDLPRLSRYMARPGKRRATHTRRLKSFRRGSWNTTTKTCNNCSRRWNSTKRRRTHFRIKMTPKQKKPNKREMITSAPNDLLMPSRSMKKLSNAPLKMQPFTTISAPPCARLWSQARD
jgi:tetratricopeptide (TPR) repeat protein